MSCYCCHRSLPLEASAYTDRCDGCRRGDCEPYRRGRGCPIKAEKLHADMGVIARGAAARGGTVRLAGGA